jgi:hypothetical protein
MNKLLFLVPLAMAAAACKTVTPEPVVRTVTVNVPVPQACVPKGMKGPPVYVDSDDALRKAKDAAERYQLLYGGRIQRVARLGEVEPVIASCPKEK